jgi:hypothetical protein
MCPSLSLLCEHRALHPAAGGVALEAVEAREDELGRKMDVLERRMARFLRT